LSYLCSCLYQCIILNFLLEQEDKEPLFDSVKAILGMLEVCTEFAQNISFNSKRIPRFLPAGYLDATTLADYLVKKVKPSIC
jgi:argininosuccinate lyase